MRTDEHEQDLVVDGDSISHGGAGAAIARASTEARGAELLLALVKNLVMRQAALRKNCSPFVLQHRYAALRLRAERGLGDWLCRFVRRGGRNKNGESGIVSRGGSSAPLPRNMKKQAADRYRKLAAIPVAVFEAYVALTARSGVLPTGLGTLGLAHTHGRPPAASVPRLPMGALKSVVAALHPIDVHVGATQLSACRTLSSEGLDVCQLRGTVVISECPRPNAMLEMLQPRLQTGRITDLVVVLPTSLGHTWQRQLRGWTLVALEGESRGTMLAFRGQRCAAFRLAARAFGIVMTVEA